MKIIDLRNREVELKAQLNEFPLKKYSLILTFIWMILGIYAYNELMPFTILLASVPFVLIRKI